MGVLPPQNLRPEVTCHKYLVVPFLVMTIYVRFILSTWCQYLSILLPVNHRSLHVAFCIAWVEREGLATNVALATSLCIEGDYWVLGSCPCLCIHVVDVGSTVLLHIHLTVFGISGGEVVKVVPIVEPNLKKTWFCQPHMATSNIYCIGKSTSLHSDRIILWLLWIKHKPLLQNK